MTHPSLQNLKGMSEQIKDCPHCKAKHGWYEKLRQAYDQYYAPLGTASHCVEQNTHGGKRKYCAECCRDITQCVEMIL